MEAGRDGFKLFVGSLPADITEEELRIVFATYGEVTNVHLMQSKSQTGHGCAFVAYAKRESAEDAISVLDGVYKIRTDANEPVKVSWAKPPGSAGPGVMGGAWSGKGDGKGWKGDYGKGKGFDAWSAAPWAMSAWDAGGWGGYDPSWDKGKGWDKGGYGKGKGGGGGGGGGAPPVAGVRLFVGNLPADIDDGAISYVFSNYGKVDKVHVMTGRSRSGQACAFIEYSNPTEAETAILTLNEKYEIRPGDGAILVKHAETRGQKGAAPY